MTNSKKFAFIMAVMMFCVSVIGYIPRTTQAAAQKVNAISFTTSNTGIELGKSEDITFTAVLDTSGVSGLFVSDENGNKIADLKETKNATYEATVTVSADKKATHTYSLNTLNTDEHTCEMNFYAPLTEADTQRDNITWDSVKSISYDISEANSTAVLTSVYRMLKADKNVAEVWYETDRIINFKTVDGVGNVFDADIMISKNNSSLYTPSNETVSKVQQILKSDNTKTETRASENCIGTKNICIIAPYYGVEDQFTERYILEAENIKNELGTGSTITAFYGNGQLTGKKADISAFKNLDNYGIIMIDSHGSLYGSQNLICVEYTTGQTNADYSAGRLVQGPDYVGVLAPFIKYYTNSLPNSLVYFGQCYGMYSNHLCNAFKDLGGAFVTGFSMSVSTIFDGRIFSEYFKTLERSDLETGLYPTVKEAYDAAVERHGSQDPYGSEKAVWKYSGNTKLVIKEVKPVYELQSVSISPESAEIKVGERLMLSLNVTPAEALADATVVWESINESVATVNDGTVLAVGKGNSIIVCSVTDELGNTISATAKITVTVGSLTVTFVDGMTGDIISTQQVESGKAAQAPEAPTHDGYIFTGWDKDFSCVTSSMTVNALYFAVGDINCDGAVNTGDATAVLKNAAELIKFNDTQLLLADFNRDGNVNTADATAILKYCAR